MALPLPTRSDLRELRPQLQAALLATLSGLALLAGAAYFHRQATAHRALVEAEGVNFQQRIGRFAAEEAELHEDLRQYSTWADRGILGAEQRTKWITALREKQRRRHLVALRYEFSPQQAHNIPLTLPTGIPSDFVTSTTELTATAIHEGDLIGFLDDLGTAIPAYVRPRRCVIERKRGQPLGVADRFQLDCQMDWITVSRAP